MSDYQNGYDKGYEDGLEDNHRIDTSLVDFFSGVSDREEEWRDGYEDGYKVAQEEKD